MITALLHARKLSHYVCARTRVCVCVSVCVSEVFCRIARTLFNMGTGDLAASPLEHRVLWPTGGRVDNATALVGCHRTATATDTYCRGGVQLVWETLGNENIFKLSRQL